MACRFKHSVVSAFISGWSIVVAGAWNTRIFTPQWIGNGRLTQMRELDLAIPMDDPSAPRIVGFDNIQLEVQFARIVVKPTRTDNPTLLKLQSTVATILTELKHTPVSAVGINFAFLDEDPSAQLTRLFDLQDNGRLAESGWVIQNSNIKRELHRDNSILNFVATLAQNGNVRFDLNYHSNVSNNTEALAAVNRDIVALKSQSEELVRQLHYPQ